MEKNSTIMAAGIPLEIARERKGLNLIKIRKEKRCKVTSMNRNFTVRVDDSINEVSMIEVTEPRSLPVITEANDHSIIAKQIPSHLDLISHYRNMIYSDIYSDQVIGMIYFRKLVSSPNPQIKPIYELGVIVRFIELLSHRHLPKLGFECLWVLTNMSCGDIAPVQQMKQLGAVELICELIESSSNPEIKEQCLWALGNLSLHREILNFNSRIASIILRYFTKDQAPTLFEMQHLSHLISNLTKEPFDFNDIQIMNSVSQIFFLVQSLDERILTSSFKTLTRICQHMGKQGVQLILEKGMLTRVSEVCNPANAITPQSVKNYAVPLLCEMIYQIEDNSTLILQLLRLKYRVIEIMISALQDDSIQINLSPTRKERCIEICETLYDLLVLQPEFGLDVNRFQSIVPILIRLATLNSYQLTSAVSLLISKLLWRRKSLFCTIPIDTYCLFFNRSSNTLEAIQELLVTFINSDHHSWLNYVKENSSVCDAVLPYTTDSTIPEELRESSDTFVNLIFH